MKTRLIISLLMLLLGAEARADSFVSILSGSWDVVANWQQNGAAATRAPQAGDAVVLMHFMQVNVNADAASVTYGADWIGINVDAGATVTVSGAVSVPNPRTGCGLNILNATSALVAGSLSMVNTAFVNNGTLTVGAGGIVSEAGSFGNYGPLVSAGPVIVNGGSFANTSTMTTGDLSLMGNIPVQNVNNGTINAQKITISNTGLPLTNDWATINAHGGIDVSASPLNPCMGLGTITYRGTLDQSGTCKVTATNALPVVLTDFSAQQVNGAVELRWHTASELNSAFFDIQHSSDGFHFGTIGERDAAGTSSTDHSYMFVHEWPVLGLNYYRLLQVDNDGASELSNVVSIAVTGGSDIPKSMVIERGTVFEIANLADTDELFLTNVQGAHFPVKMTGQTAYIATSDLSAGTYFVTIRHGASVQNITLIVSE